MAEVNYIAGTSADKDPDGPSVEIVDPKVMSVSFGSDDKSIEEERPPEEDKPNRPSSSLWKQQKLPAWQPILTSDTVLPAFFLLGISLIPIGIGLLVSSHWVCEYEHEYTHCKMIGTDKSCADILRVHRLNTTFNCKCWHNFTLHDDFRAPVFFYYGLKKFFQNHRRYVQSRHDNQLYGKDISNNDLEKVCDPFDVRKGQPIAPCGIIANSMFNDTFKLFRVSDNSEERIDLLETNIAWPTDKEAKYRNPKPEVFAKSTHPPNWQRYVDDLDQYHPENNGYKNEHFMVWMRTAALPTFRKLWARIDHDQNILWRKYLPKGSYALLIDYNYPIRHRDWKGEKWFYLSNTSWLGGKNDFLGIAYITVGSICLVLWIAFLIVVKKFGQKPKDIVDIGPKTSYMFAKPKPKVIDSATLPLRSGNSANGLNE